MRKNFRWCIKCPVKDAKYRICMLAMKQEKKGNEEALLSHPSKQREGSLSIN
jgi:hypothetical protein